MPTYTATGLVDATVMVEVDADSPEAAAELARDADSFYPSLCHQCARDVELGDVVRVLIADETGETVYEEPDSRVVALERQLAAKREQIELLSAQVHRLVMAGDGLDEVIGELMPGIRAIALQNYAIINDNGIEWQRAKVAAVAQLKVQGAGQ